MNQLSQETSPYLLQHASNPVNWKAWNTNSLAEAIQNNQLIIISIGYSACHWCHVMEHESFEDTEVAQTMNAHFINIKVDREEHPNVDAVYMKAVQIMTGRGGWPLNIVALPDGRPIWGGTYFRKEEWINALEQLHKLYQNNPEKMIEYAEKLHQGIETISIVQKQDSKDELDQNRIKPLVEKWKKSFDLEFGGMARAPKFMMPNNYQFLLRYGYQTNDSELLDFVNLTLTKMAYGGIFDTIDGGFSRYSVDMKWHVPHFEKMLYDNGQLVSLYADAYKLTKNPLYKEIITKTLGFITRELTNKKGGFFCALDADSLNEKQELEEGAFYVWQKPTLQKLLKDDFELFSVVFNINNFGFWEKDNYVLIQNQSLEEIAILHKMEVLELESKKKSWEQILFQEREKRSKPRLDDKCLTSWNAIMLKGFVDAYKALKDDNYLEIAIENADFILKYLWTPEGNLLHNYKNGKSTINGYLEDYCFVIESFIALYEVTFEEKWLHNAKQLTDYCLEHFYDEKNQFFAFTSNLDAALIAKHFETEDNVIPASNSVMSNNLFKLSIYFENIYYKETANQMIKNIISSIDYPSAYSNWLNAFLNYSEQNKEIAFCGSDALDYNSAINELYLPNIILAGSENESNLPFLKDRFVAEKTLLYVCQNKTCNNPIALSEEVDENLKSLL
ncbi:thioredoxin domain-containing protein [Flavobacterium psychrotolerans]|uniref:Thioredoxin domain-containing protein n=1 Tax=Flavobacterium psychrotolerans TaxID=2169410 RepID=A0A2U1JNT8_9FLAO|nr:thioredoxin domain-containing protein [Flavobacterium psychrotolerans]PWA06792.1 thioredoxin domain-containing protein [Flavobacterium psychrotolerans]